ncbi:uncharacterized protein B0P05DRAFT_554917 [Gilbertella persicaria]|uniref:uncharacterized protein n=1 Tax=Gilbertella persicaria TaxID=101096 RepID=UPI002220AB71|nr:uncharacterized protein B0P05DRAFT_554917 [Gilbertella persicaria]KAI8064309.1 hypothetical protein B0P05DRAFT_554917 [Gilbertella persicaria]
MILKLNHFVSLYILFIRFKELKSFLSFSLYEANMKLIYSIVLCLIITWMHMTIAFPLEHQHQRDIKPWNRRPRQFRMQVFSRPDNRGEMQTIRAFNGASTPCWNLASKRVGSYDLNDPMVKVTFYRSSDCKGASLATYYQNHASSRTHVMIKARSVSVTKIKPVLLNGKPKKL